MTVEEARAIIDELRGRFDAPFGSSDKSTIEKLYYEVLGKTFVPTSCQTCYHDALIEIYHYIKKNNAMAAKSNYRLKAGAIINCPSFMGGKVFTNDNLTDAVASAYLKEFPKQASLFQALPAKKNKKGGKKAEQKVADEPATEGEEVNNENEPKEVADEPATEGEE